MAGERFADILMDPSIGASVAPWSAANKRARGKPGVRLSVQRYSAVAGGPLPVLVTAELACLAGILILIMMGAPIHRPTVLSVPIPRRISASIARLFHASTTIGVVPLAEALSGPRPIAVAAWQGAARRLTVIAVPGRHARPQLTAIVLAVGGPSFSSRDMAFI
jgi:hypothetical protein